MPPLCRLRQERNYMPQLETRETRRASVTRRPKHGSRGDDPRQHKYNRCCAYEDFLRRRNRVAIRIALTPAEDPEVDQWEALQRTRDGERHFEKPQNWTSSHGGFTKGGSFYMKDKPLNN